MVSQLIQGSQTIVAEPEEYTPRSRRILEIVNREAMRFRASAIGTGTSFDCHIKRNRLCCGTAVIFPWCAGTKGLSGYCTCIGMDARAAKADMPSAKEQSRGGRTNLNG